MNNKVVNSDFKVDDKSITHLKSGQGRNLNNKNKGLSAMMSLHYDSCKRTSLSGSRSKRTETQVSIQLVLPSYVYTLLISTIHY